MTLSEMIISVALIGLLASIALPKLVHARSQSDTAAGAAQIPRVPRQATALEKPQQIAVAPEKVLVSSNSLPPSPSAGTYSASTVLLEPVSSLSTATAPHAIR